MSVLVRATSAPRKPVEDLEIDLLLAGVAERYGYDFRNYSRISLTRRIRRVLRVEGLGTVSSLQERVLRDPVSMARFVEAVSMRRTSMFRDPDVYQLLRNEVVPRLRTYPFVRVWHAGCATGEEAYSLAILLHEGGFYERCRIYATEVSDSLLDRARAGVYSMEQLRTYEDAYRAADGREDFSTYYAADEQNAVMCRWLRKNIVFSQHNLVCDGAFNEFQLIVCRNVLTYFDSTLQARVARLLHRSLATFGVLVLGKRETLQASDVGAAYRELREGTRVFRRTR